jgi:hypothetical protein
MDITASTVTRQQNCLNSTRITSDMKTFSARVRTVCAINLDYIFRFFFLQLARVFLHVAQNT